jgi:hypothetical protein
MTFVTLSSVALGTVSTEAARMTHPLAIIVKITVPRPPFVEQPRAVGGPES